MQTKPFEDYSNKFYDWNKQIVSAWIENLPTGGTSLNISESVSKALKFQEEVAKTYLDIQEKTVHILLEAQKQAIYDYFQAVWKFESLRRDTAATATNATVTAANSIN